MLEVEPELRESGPRTWAPRPSRPSVLWLVAKWVALVVTVAAIVSLGAWPEASSQVLWYAIVPILPATFLVNVELWRNVCPLATLNMLARPWSRARRLEPNLARVTQSVGIGIFFLAVPARRFLLNENGAVAGMVIAALAVVALVAGFFFDRKAGFCNAFCPVLPVERLYGQRPLLPIENSRCTPCSGCTRTGCLDLDLEQSALRALGTPTESRRWTFTPFGAFALAFPGFVLGYFLIGDVALTEALAVYAEITAWSIGSWVLLAAIFTLLKTPSSTALLWLAGLAVGLYYWYTPPSIATAFDLPVLSVTLMRVVTLGLVAVWLVRAVRGVGDGRPVRFEQSPA